MIGIEQNIDTFFIETEKSTKTIIDGSDEHLDMILSIIRPLDMISKKFENFNETLYNTINSYSEEQIQNVIMPKLRQLNKSCLTLIGAIRTCFLYRDVRTSLKNYNRQYDFFREIMHDAQNFRVAKDDEFDNLLNELNAI